MRLWQGSSPACNVLNISSENEWATYGSSCTLGGATLVDMATLLDPFMSQVPSGFNTGLIQQFVPRINSTASIDTDISDFDWPKDCQHESNSFYVAYSGSIGNPAIIDSMNFSLEACMPGDQRQTKWKNTSSRQDFEEVLYLNISTRSADLSSPGGQTLYQVKLKTTAGYFELPSYAHPEPGPLLNDSLGESCGSDCMKQQHKRQATTNSSALLGLESVPNKGPLLTTAMALFGEASFIANRYFQPEAYIASSFELNMSRSGQNAWHCQEMVPFAGLMVPTAAPDADTLAIIDPLLTCADNMMGNKEEVYEQIVSYLQLFQYEPAAVSNAFTAAAYLANQAWLLQNSQDCGGFVYFDTGAESRKPYASLAGVITISLLLSAFLLGLLAIALYSSRMPRWTSQLNSFAMVRIGASIADRISLKLVNEIPWLDVLDEIPGTIGSAASDVDDVHELSLGAPKPLSKDIWYHSFDRKLSPVEKTMAVQKRNRAVVHMNRAPKTE